jgi:hypothetical protein
MSFYSVNAFIYVVHSIIIKRYIVKGDVLIIRPIFEAEHVFLSQKRNSATKYGSSCPLLNNVINTLLD